MARAFVDLSNEDSSGEVFIDIAEIQAIRAWGTGSKIFIRGSDIPFKVCEHPRRVLAKMEFKES